MDQSVQRHFSRSASGLLVTQVRAGPRLVDPEPEPALGRRSRVGRQDGEVRDLDSAVLYWVGGVILVATLLSMAA